MSLRITKESGSFDLPVTEKSRISKNVLAELLGCDPFFIDQAAKVSGAQIIKGPKVDPDLEPVDQLRVSDLPALLRSLHDIAQTHDIHMPDPLAQWAERLDIKENFQTETLAGYTLIYTREPDGVEPHK